LGVARVEPHLSFGERFMTSHEDKPLVDRARLDTVTAGDDELRAELVALFIEQARRRVAECESAEPGTPALRHAAHALSGSAQNFGAPRLAELARLLELEAPSPTRLTELRIALDATLAQLRDP
jgi:HPt (histidine-containing phosphotransfer) domain-containing protein